MLGGVTVDPSRTKLHPERRMTPFLMQEYNTKSWDNSTKLCPPSVYIVEFYYKLVLTKRISQNY